jgi:cytoskeletal protein CcmA (bactofilin family)
MSTNGQLVFTDVDKITFKGVGNTSNAVVDTVTGKIGVGTDNPDANLHVLGNSYVSTNLELGGTLIMGTVNVSAHHSLEAVTAEGNTTPLTVEFSNATTGIVTTGNVEVGKELTVTGNTTLSSNLIVSGNVEVGKELTVTGNTTLSSNLIVSGNVEVAKELTVTGNATVSSNLTVSGNVEVAKELTVTGNATVSSNLTVAGHIHQEDGRWKFDFENRRPARLTPTTEFRYVVVEGTADFPSVYQPNTNYVIPESGTTVYQYTPSTDTTTTLISSTSSDDTVGSIALTAGTEIYTTSVKPFVLAVPGYNHAVIPFTCIGYYFGFANTRYLPTTIFMYAPYEDVTVNLYLNKAITETPTETFTLTKQTVVTRTINPSYSSTSSDYGYTIEAVNGVIMASRSGSDTAYNGDHEILYPASNLGYNMTSSSGDYYNHDIFNTGGYEEGKHRFSSGVVQTGPTFYSPAGIPHFSSCGGDGDGGDTTSIIPHEIVGEVYYIPHTIPGYMIGFLTNRQSVMVEYYYSGQWYSAHSTNPTGPQYGVSAYNCIPYRGFQVAANLDGGRSTISGNAATSTLWRFTSDHPFVLRVESEEVNVNGDWDEYMAVGWLNSTRTTPIYKPPCFTTPVMYKANLTHGVNVATGGQDVWVEYNIFSVENNSFNRVYGGGFSTYGTGTRIIVPAPGLYRCTATVYLSRTDGVSARTSTEISFSKYNGSATGAIGEGYIREYEDHDDTSISITSIVNLDIADWNSSSTDCPPHIGLLFRRSGTITQPVYLDSVSTVILELIR